MPRGKEALLDAVYMGDQETIHRVLSAHPGRVRYLIAGLNETDPDRLEAVLAAFVTAAGTLERERRLELVRKLMWQLNEESGNNCPDAALAIARIALVDREAVMPHIPVLQLYAQDPSQRMRRSVSSALASILDQ